MFKVWRSLKAKPPRFRWIASKRKAILKCSKAKCATQWIIENVGKKCTEKTYVFSVMSQWKVNWWTARFGSLPNGSLRFARRSFTDIRWRISSEQSLSEQDSVNIQAICRMWSYSAPAAAYRAAPYSNAHRLQPSGQCNRVQNCEKLVVLVCSITTILSFSLSLWRRPVSVGTFLSRPAWWEPVLSLLLFLVARSTVCSELWSFSNLESVLSCLKDLKRLCLPFWCHFSYTRLQCGPTKRFERRRLNEDI